MGAAKKLAGRKAAAVDQLFKHYEVSCARSDARAACIEPTGTGACG
jgi:hypothetical protein